MGEVLHCRRTGTRLPPRALLLTCDDAYADFAENAWPILAELSLPATVFGFGQFCSRSPCVLNPSPSGTDFKLRMGTTNIISDDDAEVFEASGGFPTQLRNTAMFTLPDVTVDGAICFGDSGGHVSPIPMEPART